MVDSLKPKLLLHCCCAPCGTYPVQLLGESYHVTAFFYNPNILPKEEYYVREKEIRSFMKMINVSLLIGSYDLDEWMCAVKGFENEPEGGKRCEICYRFRLEKTVVTAKDKGFEFFTSTLSISPHKDAEQINRIGDEVGNKFGITFFRADFKKKDGFKISCELSRKAGIYRQNYCGCIYSRREALLRNNQS